MAIEQHLTTVPPPEARAQGLKVSIEVIAALAGTAFIAALLLLTTFNAGPLWRDETNSVNVALMPSLKELWANLPFESFPPPWPLLLRAWSVLGMASNDGAIRVLGLFIGLFFLGSLWLCSRWLGARTPILSIALLGSLPAFLFTVSSLRAYGCAMCLLVLSFGLIWRALESPSTSRFLLAGSVSLLFTHFVFYDVLFLGAVLSGAGAVAVRRRQWRVLSGLVTIGAICVLSLVFYLPIIRETSGYLRMVRIPFFSFSTLWEKLSEVLALQSSAYWGPAPGPALWVWIALFLAGTAMALSLQLVSKRRCVEQTLSATGNFNLCRDRALFCGVALVCGVGWYLVYLLYLKFPTQPWYYFGMLSLAAISLEGLLNANLTGTRLLCCLRIALLAFLVICSLRPLWEEAHTRRTNIDLLATVLAKNADTHDLIIVQSAWEGVTFDRYYSGGAPWATLPPLASHKVHRTDLMWQSLNQPNPMAPVLEKVTETLKNGGRVWVLGEVAVVEQAPKPLPLPPRPNTQWSLAPYYHYWTQQLAAHLLATAAQTRKLSLQLDTPINARENLPLIQFSGYRTPAP